MIDLCVLNEWVGNDEMEVGSKKRQKKRVMKMDGQSGKEGNGGGRGRSTSTSWLGSKVGLGVGVGVCEGGKKERQGQDGETCLVSSPAQIPSFASLLPRRPFLLPTAPCRSKMC